MCNERQRVYRDHCSHSGADRWSSSSPLSRSPAPDRRILTSPVPASPSNPMRRLILSPSPLTQSEYKMCWFHCRQFICSPLIPNCLSLVVHSAQWGAENEAGEETSESGVTFTDWEGLPVTAYTIFGAKPTLTAATCSSCAFNVEDKGLQNHYFLLGNLKTVYVCFSIYVVRFDMS